MILYADTSALVKLVVDEEGSGDVAASVGAVDVLATALVGYAELRAALGAAYRDGRLPTERHEAALVEVEDLWSQVSAVAIDEPLVRHAGQLASPHGLRAYEALHLAALMRTGAAANVRFACFDGRLRDAARVVACDVVPT